jgi:hypothetical protein
MSDEATKQLREARAPKTGAEATSIRPSTHGDFTDGARFTQSTMDLAMTLPGWQRMTPVQREGFHMIVHKLQRVAAGDPDYAEHWVDISGYGDLVAKRCTK